MTPEKITETIQNDKDLISQIRKEMKNQYRKQLDNFLGLSRNENQTINWELFIERVKQFQLKNKRLDVSSFLPEEQEQIDILNPRLRYQDVPDLEFYINKIFQKALQVVRDYFTVNITLFDISDEKLEKFEKFCESEKIEFNYECEEDLNKPSFFNKIYYMIEDFFEDVWESNWEILKIWKRFTGAKVARNDSLLERLNATEVQGSPKT